MQKGTVGLKLVGIAILAAVVVVITLGLVLRASSEDIEAQEITQQIKLCDELCVQDNDLIKGVVKTENGVCKQGSAPNFCASNCTDVSSCTLVGGDGGTCLVTKKTCIGDFCGDGICGVGEDKISCPEDCSLVFLPDINVLSAEFNFSLGPIIVLDNAKEIESQSTVLLNIPKQAHIFFAQLNFVGDYPDFNVDEL